MVVSSLLQPRPSMRDCSLHRGRLPRSSIKCLSMSPHHASCHLVAANSLQCSSSFPQALSVFASQFPAQKLCPCLAGMAGARFQCRAGDARLALKLVSPTPSVHIPSRAALPRSSHCQELSAARAVETTSLSRWATVCPSGALEPPSA
jgi:hypothetical protein